MKSTVEITDLAYGGKGVGRIDGKVVFVPFTAPGDVAEVEVIEDKKGFYEGRLVTVVTPSPHRVEHRCPHYGDCGGCSLQHISYDSQVSMKQKTLEETLRRIGGVEPDWFDPPTPSPSPWAYRTRARFHAEGERLGFHRLGTRDLVEVGECPVLNPVLTGALESLREALKGVDTGRLYAAEAALADYPSTGGWTVLLHVRESEPADWSAILGGAEGLRGFEVRCDPAGKFRGRKIAASGERAIKYRVMGYPLTASVGVFTQVNLAANEHLVEKAAAYAAADGKATVADLFSGMGNLTIPVGAGGGGAVGVETNPEAVKLGTENARGNGLDRVVFERGRAAEWLKRNLKGLEERRPLVIILDPPRGGEPGATRTLTELSPERVVYVSCNPPTLARDVSRLFKGGLNPARAAMIDMFPQTYHIESVVGLELA